MGRTGRFPLLFGGLTPSYRQPSLVAWIAYSVVLTLLTVIGLRIAKDWPVRIFLLAECIVLHAVTIHLLRLFSHFMI